MRSKYTSSPCVSTIATAIVQLFFFASAIAAGAIFLAVSAVIDGPYIGCACAKARAGIPAAIAKQIINGAATRVIGNALYACMLVSTRHDARDPHDRDRSARDAVQPHEGACRPRRQ